MSESIDPVNGNYSGCLAAMALEYGERDGNVDGLEEKLEIVSSACPDKQADSDFCLLAPVAAHIGLVAIESIRQNWWPTRQIIDLSRTFYPNPLLGYEVDEYNRWPQCFGYREPKLRADVHPEATGLSIKDGQTVGSLVYVSAYGDPVNSQLAYFEGIRGRKALTEKDPLNVINKVLCSSTDQSGQVVPAAVDVVVTKELIGFRERINGLCIQERNPRVFNEYDYSKPGISRPEGQIVLRQPRERVIEVKLNPDVIKQYYER